MRLAIRAILDHGIFLLSLFVLIAGCTQTGGKKFDSSGVSSIRAGISTTSDVLDRLGQPLTRQSMPGGKEIWTYQFSRSTSPDGAKAMIPVYGPFSDYRLDIFHESVMVQFTDRLVTDCTYMVSRSQRSNRLGAYTNLESSDTRTTKCGDLGTAGYSRGQVREVQTLLNQHGYEAGPPDGIIGRQTRAAIIQYQQARGMHPDGMVSDYLLQLLKSESM
jgi:hypothetical protein